MNARAVITLTEGELSDVFRFGIYLLPSVRVIGRGPGVVIDHRLPYLALECDSVSSVVSIMSTCGLDPVSRNFIAVFVSPRFLTPSRDARFPDVVVNGRDPQLIVVFDFIALEVSIMIAGRLFPLSDTGVW